jgi:hypothetical protein
LKVPNPAVKTHNYEKLVYSRIKYSDHIALFRIQSFKVVVKIVEIFFVLHTVKSRPLFSPPESYVHIGARLAPRVT